jgi:hypothetical protein
MQYIIQINITFPPPPLYQTRSTTHCRAVDQAASRWLRTAEQRVRFQGKVVLGQIAIHVFQFAPASILPTVLHTHSFIYHRRYITLAVDGVFK